MKYKYLKGSAEDFDGAPDWALQVYKSNARCFVGAVGQWKAEGSDCTYRDFEKWVPKILRGELIAHREPITECTRQDGVMFDEPIGMPLNEFECQQQATTSKYTRYCKGVQVDVYDVLQAFDVTNPALQHLIKKALCVGIRGHKTKQQDLQDIIDSAIRAKELESNK